MKHFSNEETVAVKELEQKLKAFYAKASDYSAYVEISDHPVFWDAIREKVKSLVDTGKSCRILEVGAGKSGIKVALGEFGTKVELVVQDVSGLNQNYLNTVADKVLIGDVTQIEESFDIICSTYVFEHLTHPKRTLAHLLKLLTPQGSMFLLCPCYDLPFYLSPSAKYLPIHERLFIAIWLMWHRLLVLCGKEPDFLIHTEPSVLHSPWFRDADAVHWVSRFDLMRFLRNKYQARRIPLYYRGLKAFIWENFCLLCVEITAKS